MDTQLARNERDVDHCKSHFCQSFLQRELLLSPEAMDERCRLFLKTRPRPLQKNALRFSCENGMISLMRQWTMKNFIQPKPCMTHCHLTNSRAVLLVMNRTTPLPYMILSLAPTPDLVTMPYKPLTMPSIPALLTLRRTIEYMPFSTTMVKRRPSLLILIAG